ncbi:MAG: lysophospholipid acyltransferase family protein [Immundisolibacter sp.]|jgi:KDO2-lipid IV(A) lauroyltransferase|uniref:lysophospholipid acyltransferase family protein n=1 Tax=Immundisolibacter sp. TaxID=1934948 RepID=UPI0019A7DDC0|nr:lysophospholipid acyltransferase family protein [Immundisolibacter sp.]MBC7161421.1 lysophospholipid acyltransferase family protein [Immundisolibacter sp.]
MATLRKRVWLPLRRVWRRGVFRLLRAVARALASRPLTTRRVGRFVGGLNYALRPAQRRRDLANLRLALPGRPAAELPAIARESLCDASVGALEFLQMVDGRLELAQFLGPITAHGREHLDRALAGGRGVLGVGLHLGHFSKVPLWLAQAGYPVTIVIREARQVPPGYYIGALQRLGIEAIRIERDQAAAPRVLDALRRGRLVMIYLDQGVKNDGGIQIEFLGKRVPMPAGPLVLARRARAPIVPVFLHPELHEVVIHPPLPAPAGTLREDDPTLQTLYRLAEAEIRAHPAFWQWRYRRWGRS